MSMRSACARRGRWPDVILVFGSINIAAGLGEGLALPAARHRASIAAGLECRIPGAQPSLPTRGAIDATTETHWKIPSPLEGEG